jgi:hypothetical protein
MLLETIDPAFFKGKLDYIDLSVSGLRDALRGTGNKTLTDLDTDLSNIYAKLDVALSTRASESTLSGIKTGTDYLDDIYGRLDVALSTRSSESTLSALSGKFPSAAALGDALANPTTTIIGSALLGFDGTNWERIMTDGSNRIKAQLDSIPNPSNLDITLSALRDALLAGTTSYPGGLDDIYNKLNTQLDVVLSSRASESTLSGLSGKFPSAAALSDSLSNPTTTIIGNALLGFDGTYWRRVRVDTSGRLAIQNEPNLDVALSTRLADSKIPNALAQISKDIAGSTVYGLAVIASLAHDYTRMPYLVDDISVSTTEASTSIAAPGAKIVKITNKGDTDCLIGINASVPTTNPMKVRARTVKIFLFSGATAIYYKTATGSTTISIEWQN